MNRKGAILLPVLISLVFVFLGLSAGAAYLYQREHAQNIILQSQIDDLNARQRLTEDKLDSAKKLAADVQLKLQEAKAQIDTLTTTLNQEKTSNTDLSNKLEQLNADLEQQKSSRQELENSLKLSQDEGKKVQEQLKTIIQQKTDLETKLKDLEASSNGVELGKVVVNNDFPVVDTTLKGKAKKAAEINDAKERANARVLNLKNNDQKELASSAKALNGKIMVVNKEFNFVVINLGSKDGVSLGDEFIVSRAGKAIGEIKIEKVHDAMSAAGFAPELNSVFKENDLITQKAK